MATITLTSGDGAAIIIDATVTSGGKGMATVNVYIPDDLKARMKAEDPSFNWSRLFQEAVELALMEARLCREDPLRLQSTKLRQRTQCRAAL